MASENTISGAQSLFTTTMNTRPKVNGLAAAIKNTNQQR